MTIEEKLKILDQFNRIADIEHPIMRKNMLNQLMNESEHLKDTDHIFHMDLRNMIKEIVR